MIVCIALNHESFYSALSKRRLPVAMVWAAVLPIREEISLAGRRPAGAGCAGSAHGFA